MLANRESGTIHTALNHHAALIPTPPTTCHTKENYHSPNSPNLLVDGTVRCRGLFGLSIFNRDGGIHSTGVGRAGTGIAFP